MVPDVPPDDDEGLDIDEEDLEEELGDLLENDGSFDSGTESEKEVGIPDSKPAIVGTVSSSSSEPSRDVEVATPDSPTQATSSENISESPSSSSEPSEFIPSASSLIQESVDETQTPEYWESLPAHVEVALFEAGRSMTEPELVELLSNKYRNLDKNRVRWALRKIMRALEEQKSALELINPTKDKWSYQIRRDFPEDYIERLRTFIPKDYYVDKQTSIVLTEVAYRQPVRSSEIVKILGPDVYPILHALEEKGLIYGEKEKQYNILRTTEKFAELFAFDPELRNLKIQLVWRLKKMIKSESQKDREALEQLKRDREKFEKSS
ncbi:MAG: SMC-Scp complex subunit ScpB [Candidatus Helarchaeota archaeon]